MVHLHENLLREDPFKKKVSMVDVTMYNSFKSPTKKHRRRSNSLRNKVWNINIVHPSHVMLAI